MFGWLRKLRQTPPPHEARWRVEVDSEAIRVTDESGDVRSVAKADLAGAAIETNDSGPWGIDVWWLLFRAGDEIACIFPLGATGEQAAVDYLAALPDFDQGEMDKAMRSADNLVFPVWRREAPGTGV